MIFIGLLYFPSICISLFHLEGYASGSLVVLLVDAVSVVFLRGTGILGGTCRVHVVVLGSIGMSVDTTGVSTKNDDDESQEEGNPAKSDGPASDATEVSCIFFVKTVEIANCDDNPENDGDNRGNNKQEEENGGDGPAVHFIENLVDLTSFIQGKNFFS